MDFDIQIDFQLLDTLIAPRKITERLGILPDDAIEKGARNKELDLPRQNIWSLRSHAKSDEVLHHWIEIERKIDLCEEKIKEIAQSGRAKFTIIINNNKRIPSIIIPPAMSRFAGFVDAEIDIDHIQ